MSVSKEFVAYILDLLQPLGDIQMSRMFGGAVMKVGNTQLGVLFQDKVYFKVIDIKLQERYKKEGSQQFTYTRKDKKDRVVIKNWWSVPEGAMDNSEEMVKLAKEILQQYDHPTH